MTSAVVTVIAFIAALVILPRYVFGRRGGIKVKFRYGPSGWMRFGAGAARLFVQYWMYTFPIATAALLTFIGFLVI